MPTFVQWERTVLEHAYDLVDHVSLHAYFEEGEAGDLASGHPVIEMRVGEILENLLGRGARMHVGVGFVLELPA
jgi:alpha-L-arabinofuranosidase